MRGNGARSATSSGVRGAVPKRCCSGGRVDEGGEEGDLAGDAPEEQWVAEQADGAQ
jgi:hypothetical protein